MRLLLAGPMLELLPVWRPGQREDAELLMSVLETRIIMKSTRAFMANRLKI